MKMSILLILAMKSDGLVIEQNNIVNRRNLCSLRQIIAKPHITLKGINISRTYND